MWAEGHMGICRSSMSFTLSRGQLWLLPICCMCTVSENKSVWFVSGSCPVRVRDVRFVSRMSGFKLDILDMPEHDTVRSCPVVSGNMSGHVR